MRRFAIAAAVAVLLLASAAGAIASGWSIAHTPTPTRLSPVNFLSGVSCVSASDCTAVGGSIGGYRHDKRVPLAERWDGSGWSVVHTANRGRGSVLSGVSCVSARDCIAVGYSSKYYRPTPFGPLRSNDVALAERWDGTGWSVVPTPSPTRGATAYSLLNGVACVSARDCIAVGSYRTTTEHGTLVERWDGSGWSVVPTPKVTGAFRSVLRGVSCVSARECTAVGDYTTYTSTKQVTLVERWNGTEWSVVHTPNPTGAYRSALRGVSCVSARDCTAVGHSYSFPSRIYVPLAERWNGTRWSIKPNPNPTGASDSVLTGLSCASASDCIAVGDHYNGTEHRTLIERWDGTGWSVVPTRDPATGARPFSVLNGVSCVSASDCTAVGDYFKSKVSVTLAERWNGTGWSINQIPSATLASNSVLNGVSCVSASDCTAVGTFYGNADLALVERWHGTRWSIKHTPNPARGFLYGVSCVSASDCTAVGIGALVERWNGTRWSIKRTPNPARRGLSELSGVSCVSASDCTAVGALAGNADRALVERWNGTRWSIKPTPDPTGASSSALSGVSCVSASACTAAGAYDKGGKSRTLVERWNGTGWSVVPTPSPPGSSLNAVSCASASDCTAVGSGPKRALVERWNGTRWSIQPTPDPTGASSSELSGVSCVSASACTAAGAYDKGGKSRTLVERWNGTGWSVVPTPSPPGSSLNAVSCASASDCTAAGRYYSHAAFANLPLVERWNRGG